MGTMLWRTPSKVRPAAGFIEPCIPTLAAKPPSGPQWVYEIKHDGYRLMVRKAGDRVRIYTRRGADWTVRYPLIADAARALKARSALLDGEGVICGPDGVANFDRLHAKVFDHEAVLYAFDLLEHDGDDLRALALSDRKTRLQRLLDRKDQRILFNEHIATDGTVVFDHACRMGLEGIVAKRLDLPYRSGKAKCWVKVKNPKSPAMLRIEDGTW
jgi:bifunctional non-homologous end joining protein LigD